MPTYPITLPFAPFHVDWEKLDRVGLAESEFTFAQQVQIHQGDLRTAEFLYRPMVREDAAQLVAALESLRGGGTFYLGPTGQEKTPRGIATGSPQVNGAGQTGYTLLTKGWTPGQTGILKAGDWLAFGGQLARNEADVNSDGGGLATLTLTTRIHVATTDNATITVNSPVGTFRLVEPRVSWSVDEVQHQVTRFKAREAI